MYGFVIIWSMNLIELCIQSIYYILSRFYWNWNTSKCVVSMKLEHFKLSAALQWTGLVETGTLHIVSCITIDMFHWNWNTSYCQLHYSWYVSLKIIVEVVQSWIGIYILYLWILYLWIYLPLDLSTCGSIYLWIQCALQIHQALDTSAWICLDHFKQLALLHCLFICSKSTEAVIEVWHARNSW